MGASESCPGKTCTPQFRLDFDAAIWCAGRLRPLIDCWPIPPPSFDDQAIAGLVHTLSTDAVTADVDENRNQAGQFAGGPPGNRVPGTFHAAVDSSWEGPIHALLAATAG